MQQSKYRANSVNMIDLLKHLNEPIEKKGKHNKWLKHKSVSFKDNKWYQHSLKRGGLPIDFLTTFFNQDYSEAISYLNTNFETKDYDISSFTNNRKFVITKQNHNNNQVITYLKYFRFIDKKIIDYFINKDILYEDLKYHNCNFAGKDNNGQIVHIHAVSTHKSLYDYKGIVSGSNTSFPFNLIGKSNQVFVFESPIDLLSYLTLNPDNFKVHSYLALCGLSIKPIKAILELYQHLDTVNLCLDNDIAGESAKAKFKEELIIDNKISVKIINPKFKDFNEDLKFINHQPVIKGIRSPFYEFVNENKNKIIDDTKNQKTKHLKDLFNDFSKFYYIHNSKSLKQKEKSKQYLLNSATTALLLATQHYKHLEKSFSISDLLDQLINENDSFMNYVDTTKNYTLFIKDLDNLKTLFNTSFYHRKDEKLEIITTLTSLAKKAIYSHVYLTLKERNI